MHTSKAKVYPLNKLMDCSETVDGKVFVNPSIVDTIDPRNHMFDVPERANRKEKRASACIKPHDAPAKGARPVRERHYCDQSKILPNKLMIMTYNESS